MNEKIFLGLVVFLSGVLAHAGVHLDFRGDYKSDAAYKNSSNTEVSSQQKMTLSRLRLIYSGQFNEKVSFFSRFNFQQGFINDPTNTYQDGVTKAIDAAEVTQKMGENINLTFGKMASSMMSAWEGQTSPGDFYFASSLYYFPNLTGAKLEYKFDEPHAVYLLVTDYDQNPTDATQNRNALGLAYKGFFLDKALGFILSYHALPTTTSSGDQTNSYLAAGLMYKIENIYVDLNYLSRTQPRLGFGSSDYVVGSFVGTLKYFWNEWTPMMKLESTNFSKDSIGITNNVLTYNLGVEYKPVANENLRYHLQYVSKTTSNDSTNPSTNPTVTQNTLYAGIRLVTP
ncbi:MAG TPA: hypothetical protein PLJ21_10815 [Pseudobdellovibrionaceae bacterium]|nr:hypothetical protein [Pseudobdellovibrionaceae bacterium]